MMLIHVMIGLYNRILPWRLRQWIQLNTDVYIIDPGSTAQKVPRLGYNDAKEVMRVFQSPSEKMTRQIEKNKNKL